MTKSTLRRLDVLVRRRETLGTVMQTLAGIHGGRRLVEEADGGLRITYLQACKRVNRWAGGIQQHTDLGDRVVVATPNGYEQFLLCLAAARAGCIPVPVNPEMRHDEIVHVTRDSGASLVLHGPAQVDGADPLSEAEPAAQGDIAALFYTSGTTGVPKGAELTHRALVGQMAAGAAWYAGLRRDEAVVSLPVAHIMGFAVLMGFAWAGIPAYVIPHFRPDTVLDAIERRRASIFIGVPAMYRLMDEAGAQGRDLTCVRVWGSGADVMPEDLALEFKKRGATATLPLIGPVGEALFVEGYGMVELGGGAAAKLSPPGLRLGLGESVGVSLPGYHLKVVDDDGREVGAGEVGELWIRGPGVIKGYWNAPDATAATITEDGWLRSGDLARRGPFGSVLFVGRAKDVIKHGGYSVYALEVQEALERHPAVLEAAVLGLPDERVGEVPVAAVRLAEGASLDELRLEEWAAEHLADYKVPKRVVAVDELPRTGTRKVQKRQLLALF
ncbi:MAG: AMP-binding protein [Acidimicrobiales bacterium]|jgi:acyl-CoA synthetase (AMP-forming)/AMP-acid ligase II|nr:AMP-binding protein [Acidimicrobiales bacterium]